MPVERANLLMAVLMILLAVGLISIGVIFLILGVGNILNGGVYIKPPASYAVAATGVGALSVGAFFVFIAVRLLKRGY